MRTEAQQLHILQAKVLDFTLLMFAMVSVAANGGIVLFHFWKGIPLDSYWFWQAGAAGLLYVLALLRKRLSKDHKILGILLILILALVISLLEGGIHTSAKIFIIAVPVFLSFLTHSGRALGVLLLSLGVYVLFGFVYLPSQGQHADPTWLLTDISTLLMTALGLLYISYHFKDSILSYLKKIREQAVEMDDTERKFRLLFEEAGDAITLLRPDSGFFDANRTACDYFKCSRDELLTKKPEDVSPEHQRDGMRSSEKAKLLIALVLKGEDQRFEWLHRDSLGTLFDVSVALKKIELSGRIYIQAILRDITEDKRKEAELEAYRRDLEILVRQKTEELEEANRALTDSNQDLSSALKELKETQLQLMQSEKMASLGTLTSGVAHEINNPLNYILGAYMGLEEYFGRNPSLEPELISLCLKGIKTGVDRTAEIVKSLNQMSRDSGEYMEPCEIHAILDNCLIMLRPASTFENIRIDTQYREGKLHTEGNIGKLHQAFMNILQNALYASKENGKVVLRTGSQTTFHWVEVEDFGSGISPKDLKRITDPFFTTKPPGQGTGLGLSITYTIIREHGGELTFDSEIGRGTRVRVELPVNSSAERSILP
ncbi:MAG: ATP-binding protein [Bacteroidales bacterium]